MGLGFRWRVAGAGSRGGVAGVGFTMGWEGGAASWWIREGFSVAWVEFPNGVG